MKKKKKKKKRKRNRRHKYCPECEEVMAMNVIRKAEDDKDFYWLLCPSCESKFALTRKQYLRGKRPDITAIKRDDAQKYRTSQTYEVGQIIYHKKLDDVGLIIDKAAAPSTVDCSGSIIESFAEIGQKQLIEGYVAA